MSDCIGTGCKAAVMQEQLEALRLQVDSAVGAAIGIGEKLAAMTAERDALLDRVAIEKAAKESWFRLCITEQAYSQQLREEVYIRSGYSRDVLDKIFPHDDTALKAALAAERERVLQELYELGAISVDGVFAAAIRSLT